MAGGQGGTYPSRGPSTTADPGRHVMDTKPNGGEKEKSI